ncbi:MAG: UPF0280 family protein [Proteobacteria bacterium]|nr:UPF0280 family protein [Pseudomonadota bacterium]MDA1308649.1 UPF0280 family protein [Pseudomonadota bacterium]
MSRSGANGPKDGVPKGTGPTAAMLPDGRRLHLQHGPIDLVIQADGAVDEVLASYRQAAQRFETMLTELVGELAVLRMPAACDARLVGAVARRMREATLPHAENFITPMAAVAGAVADEILASMITGRRLDRAYVNNGGDIALHLGQGGRYAAALVADPVRAQIVGRATVTAADPVRGLATSGRHGRSHSLGIADSVTVLAGNAAAADAAATMIANAVDLPGSTKISRAPARELSPDSDLGDRLVTVGVAGLSRADVALALMTGQDHAAKLAVAGLIQSAFLCLDGICRTVGGAIEMDLKPSLEKAG